MKLMDKEVMHKQFGMGTIIFQDANNIGVRFAIGEKRFQYPMAFEHFLKLVDEELNDELLKVAVETNEEIRTIEIQRITEKLNENSQCLDKTNTLKKNRKNVDGSPEISKEILSIHQNCFEFLINHQSNHKDFFFIPRKNNTKNRLEDGYHFIGNNSYLMITFWNGGDSVEKIHNINFGITADGNCFMEISSRSNEVTAKHLKEVVDLLEKKFNYKFEEVKINKWRFDYDSHLLYLEVLSDFIDNEKLVIDEYIRMNKEIKIQLANSKHHEKYVKKIIEMHTGK